MSNLLIALRIWDGNSKKYLVAAEVSSLFSFLSFIVFWPLLFRMSTCQSCFQQNDAIF